MKLIHAFLLAITVYLFIHIVLGWEKVQIRTDQYRITKLKNNPNNLKEEKK
jgi:hypothetical protein